MNKYRKDQLHYIVAAPSERSGDNGVGGDIAGSLAGMKATLAGYTPIDAHDRTLRDAFAAGFDDYVAKSERFRTLADQGLSSAAIAQLDGGAGDAAYGKLQTLVDAWSSYKLRDADVAARSASDAYSSSRTL